MLNAISSSNIACGQEQCTELASIVKHEFSGLYKCNNCPNTVDLPLTITSVRALNRGELLTLRCERCSYIASFECLFFKKTFQCSRQHYTIRTDSLIKKPEHPILQQVSNATTSSSALQPSVSTVSAAATHSSSAATGINLNALATLPVNKPTAVSSTMTFNKITATVSSKKCCSPACVQEGFFTGQFIAICYCKTPGCFNADKFFPVTLSPIEMEFTLQQFYQQLPNCSGCQIKTTDPCIRLKQSYQCRAGHGSTQSFQITFKSTTPGATATAEPVKRSLPATESFAHKRPRLNSAATGSTATLAYAIQPPPLAALNGLSFFPPFSALLTPVHPMLTPETCLICCECYDNDQRFKIALFCGHAICQPCFNHPATVKCPFCKSAILRTQCIKLFM